MICDYLLIRDEILRSLREKEVSKYDRLWINVYTFDEIGKSKNLYCFLQIYSLPGPT